MKIIFEKESTDSIRLEDVTKNYIIVCSGAISSQPGILSVSNLYDTDYNFRYLASGFTYGNYFSLTSGSIKDIIKAAQQKGYKIEVFKQEDWKKALRWLIDNCN